MNIYAHKGGLKLLEIDWTNWKVCAARTDIEKYYIANASTYEAVAIDYQFIYYCQINNDTDLAEFDEDYKSTTTLTTSVFDAIALANKGETLNILNIDLNRNSVAVEKGTAIASDQGAMIVGGTDSVNARILLTDNSGRLQTNTHDGSGTAISSTGTALDTNIKSQTTALKVSKNTSDNTGANPLYTQLVNRDGAVLETAFGQLRVAEEDVLVSATFADQIIPGKIQRYVEGPGTFSFTNGAIRLTAGTSVGRVRIAGEQRTYYVAGVGIHIMMSVILGDTGSSGCVRTWGAMDDRALNGFFFQLSGTTLQIVRRFNGTDTTITADNWNIDNTITVDTNGHLWEIRYQWLGVGRIIFRRDGKDVHTIEYAGTSSSTSTQNPHMVPFIDIQNSSAQGASRTMDVGSMHLSYEGKSARKAIDRNFSAASTQVPTTAPNGTEYGVLALQFRASRQNLPNASIASIRRITVVSAGSTNSYIDVRIKKNAVFGASTTFTPNEQPDTPTADWGSIVPAATVTETNATGTGYGTSVNLAYKITALGHIGETPASNASSAVSSGNPAKQITLTWPGVSSAAGYNVYRQTDGTGNFVYIGTTTDVNFTDNAHVASAATPPGSNTAEGDSWMAEAENLSSGNPGFTANTGKVVSLIRINSAQTWVQDYTSNKLTLLPGETLLITATPGSSNNLFATAIIEWCEGVP